MSNQRPNELPITKYGNNSKVVPLDQAIQYPHSVLNTTPKQYLPQVTQVPYPKQK